MLLPPIVEREMRTAIRSTGALKSRWWTAVAATVGAAIFLLLSMAAGTQVWRWFHTWLFAAAVYLAVIRPANHAAGLFAEERRNQTLGLIYLTGISSFELFVTKFFGGLLLASSELLALVPFIALPFLSGGVSLDLFLATAGALPTLLVFTMSLTIMVSMVCTDESQALAWIAGVIGVMSLAVPLIYSLGMIVAGSPPFQDRWLCLSPAYGPYLIFTGFGIAGAKPFWLAVATTWIWAAMFFVTAGWLLHRTWREDPDRGPWRSLWTRYSARLEPSRNVERMRALLASNPFQWRVEHNRRPINAAWASSGGVLAFWLLGWAVWKAHWPSPANLYATAFLLVMFVDMFQLQAPARDIASHRRDGMFELLLTVPLEPREIVDGEIRGLAKQFGPLRKALCALFVVMTLGGLATRPWTWRALVTYFLIWGLLIMFAGTNRRRSLPTIIWIALNSGRGAWAVMRSQGRAWPWLFNIYNFRNAFAAFGSGALKFPSGSETEFWVVSAGAAFAVVIMVVATFEKNPLHRRLVDEMRAIVQEPVPSPKDPRFRRWNVKERFPSDRKVI